MARPYNKKLLEKEIERQVYTCGREHFDIHHSKYTAPGRRNVPDHLFVNPYGFVFFIEFKAWGKKLTPGQAREITRLRDRKVTVYVCDNVPYGKLIMEYHKETRIQTWNP